MKLLYFLPFTISLLLIVMGLFVYNKNKKQKINLIFLRLSIAGGVWLLFYAIAYACHIYDNAYFWLRMGYCGVVFIPVTILHFIAEILKFKKLKLMVVLSYSSGIIFCILIWASKYIISDISKYAWGYYPMAGVLHPIFLLYFLTLNMISISLLVYKYWFDANDLTLIKKMQIKYLFMAFVVFLFASFDFLPNYKINVYPFGYLSTFIFILIMGYTIIRYSLMDIRVAITSAGIFLILYAGVLGVPFYLGYSTKSWVLSTTIAVVFASMGPLVFRSLQKKAENILLSEQRRYQKILIQAAKGMAKEHDLDRLMKLIVYIVKKTVRIRFVASFINEKENKLYRLKAVRGDGVDKGTVIEFSYDNPFIKYLKEKEEPFLIEELPLEIKESLDLPFYPSLIVPSSFENNPLGFMMLGEKQNNKLYTSDDINVFKILAQQSALAVENCIFMEQFRRAQERVFSAEKLASIGGMADGVAHQIKNRLNVFSVAAGEQMFEIDDFLRDHAELIENNPDLKTTFSYLRETAESLVLNVKKTTGIIQGILNFAKIEEKETMFSEFSIREILDQCVNLLLVKHQIADFPLEIEIISSDMLYGVKAQIMESMYNLIDNGYEAIKEKMDYHLKGDEKENFKPVVKVKVTQKDSSALIEIADNGAGIKEDHQKKIFAPFFTTKASSKSGSGIGMYVVRRMVEENHKGRIWFESKSELGTKVFIELPRKIANNIVQEMGNIA